MNVNPIKEKQTNSIHPYTYKYIYICMYVCVYVGGGQGGYIFYSSLCYYTPHHTLSTTILMYELVSQSILSSLYIFIMRSHLIYGKYIFPILSYPILSYNVTILIIYILRVSTFSDRSLD
jgi:predicted membrane-bound dolichyl-phosphate-mannose-protein mannosyltransferase